ncbi:MAG: S8 family serine peptidase, partial [Paracoccaceae bacterium]
QFEAKGDPLLHGEWTLLEANLIAPSAQMKAHEFTSGSRVRLAKGFNVLNLSYGMYAKEGYSRIIWSGQESSIISYAESGKAVISKAAGNDAVAIGGSVDAYDIFGNYLYKVVDYLARDLIGAESAIFVGALDANGTAIADQTYGTGTLAFYSNYAGSDLTVQAQFLVVGVESGLQLNSDGTGYTWGDGTGTGLAETSFAAPIISGYAAVLSSKFPGANATQVAHQLLDTAREDTLADYSAAKYGQGEASIFRALAPSGIDGFGPYIP